MRNCPLFVFVVCLLGTLYVVGCKRQQQVLDVNVAASTDVATDSTDAKAAETKTSDASDDSASENVAETPAETSVTTSPLANDEVKIISFDDLNIGMQVDARFRPQMLEYESGRVKELFGKRVNIAGYMNPTDTMKGVAQFILLRNLECKFGPGGQADHLVHVVMDEGLTTEFTDQVVYVEGVISLNPFPLDEPITWSIYDIKATKVSTKAPPRRR